MLSQVEERGDSGQRKDEGEEKAEGAEVLLPDEERHRRARRWLQVEEIRPEGG